MFLLLDSYGIGCSCSPLPMEETSIKVIIISPMLSFVCTSCETWNTHVLIEGSGSQIPVSLIILKQKVSQPSRLVPSQDSTYD